MPLPNDLGVLLIAHGTVSNLSEMPDFLKAIRRGRPASAELVSEMTHRYEAIGGSPLLKITDEQRRRLQSHLGRPVYVGMRFCQPTIEAAIEHAIADGVRRLVVLPLAPYSVELYADEARKRRDALIAPSVGELELIAVEPWGSHELLISAHREIILEHAASHLKQKSPILLTAHSLPLRVIESGDRYADDVAASANAIGRALQHPFELCFQSEGADGGRWLGPSLDATLEKLSGPPGTAIIVAPFGFLCDHVETLYDLDIEFAAKARARGFTLCRVPALGTHPKLLETLSSLVYAAWSRREDPLPEAVSHRGAR